MSGDDNYILVAQIGGAFGVKGEVKITAYTADTQSLKAYSPLLDAKGKLLESDLLVQQAMSNSKEQFSNSPDLAAELMNAIIDAFEAHGAMSKQALDSEKVRQGLKHILLGPAQLYEGLRMRGGGEGGLGAGLGK